jgi:threonine dehydrogenase-like Zn-dependent dehydrogenase
MRATYMYGAGDVRESMGHEFIGVVEEVGAEVATVSPGDFVIAPFAVSDGTCEFCRAGLQTSCRHGRHALAREFGATDVVAERGDEGIGRVRDLTGGGSEIVPEAVDHRPAYEQAVGIETLLPAVLDGSVRPGRVFDQTVALEDAPKGYAAMDERTALKVVVRP